MTPEPLSRHCWAVTHLSAGMPVQLVEKQIGHVSPRATLEIHGRFIPPGIDRAMCEIRINRLDRFPAVGTTEQ